MADFTALKTAIQNAIKQNGNEEITGNLLQGVLLSMVSTLGDSAINDLVSALVNEVTNRQNADGTLQTNINNEATTRGNADTALGTRIDNEVTARGNADTALQNAINAINTKLAEGYVYVGIATISTNPSTPSGKVFYIAVAAGTYTNFLNSSSQPLVLTQGINILKYNGTSWSVEQVWGVDDEPTAGSNNLVKSGGVYEPLLKNAELSGLGLIAGLMQEAVISSGWKVYACKAHLQLGKKYIIKIWADLDIRQSEVVVSLSNGLNSDIVAQPIQLSAFDLSKGVCVEYTAPASSQFMLVSLNGVSESAKINAIIKEPSQKGIETVSVNNSKKVFRKAFFLNVSDINYTNIKCQLKAGKTYIVKQQSYINENIGGDLYISTSQDGTIAGAVDTFIYESGLKVPSFTKVFTPVNNTDYLVISYVSAERSGSFEIEIYEYNESESFYLSDLYENGNVKVCVFSDTINSGASYNKYLPCDLKANNTYHVEIKSSVELGQSGLWLSTNNIPSISGVIDTFIVANGFDISKGIIMDYTPLADSSYLILSINDIANAGELSLIVIDESQREVDALKSEVEKLDIYPVVKSGNISSVRGNGYAVKVKEGVTELDAPILYDYDNVRLFGVMWGYSNDPNGVFPATKGCIIDNHQNNTPAIHVIGLQHRAGTLEEFGINGKAVNSDVRALFDKNDISKYAGIYINCVLDQFRIHHVNIQGCGAALCIDNVGLDACHIERINADGCNCGIYGITGAYFNSIQNCLLSDCYNYGLCLIEASQYPLISWNIENNIFVRNGYGHDTQVFDTPAASVYIEGQYHKIISNSFDSSGVYQNNIPTEGGNGTAYRRTDVPSLYIKGDYCIISNNTFVNNSDYDIVIEGDGNIIDGTNIGVHKIKIMGDNNIVRYIAGCTTDIVSGNGNIIEDSI